MQGVVVVDLMYTTIQIKTKREEFKNIFWKNIRLISKRIQFREVWTLCKLCEYLVEMSADVVKSMERRTMRARL